MLRRLMDAPEPGYGLLAGLAHPALGRALTRIHEDPGGAWTLERMAEEAGMSRSAFAETFRHVVGLNRVQFETCSANLPKPPGGRPPDSKSMGLELDAV
jgi:AraC-like DNA-binding protein